MTSIDPRLTRAESPVARAVDAACVFFDRPDLQRAADFYGDFGLSLAARNENSLQFRAEGGYGPCCHVRKATTPAFRGLGLAVASRDDLLRLSELPGATAITPAEGYEGGEQVQLTDPAGFRVRAVFGPSPGLPAVRQSLRQNVDDRRDRVNEGQRPPLRPSTVLRLGHVAIGVVDFFKTARWYMDTFGLIASDIQTIGDNEPALVFMRCDRGDQPSDHHTVVVAQNVVNAISHCAFEVIDLDDVAMGQEFLLSRGWKHAWGMGRHVLGSQIFDYWRDPWGDKVEHFCDSDLFTAEHPTTVSPLTTGSLYQWGPPTPKDFEAPKITPGFLAKAIGNIRRSDEMSLARAKQLLRTIGDAPRPWLKKR